MPLSQADATSRAEAELRAYCGWHVTPVTTETLTLDGPGSHALLLPTLRLTAVASVTEEGVLVDAASYEWSAAGIIRRTSGWPPGWAEFGTPRWTDQLRGLVVAFTHGLATWPLDVQVVRDRVAARLIEVDGSSQVLSQVGAVRYAVGVEGLRNVATLSEQDMAVLDRYRIPKRP